MVPAHDTSERPLDPAVRDWLAAVWAPVARTQQMAGGAGARRYWRIVSSSGATAVLMHAVAEDPAILPPALRHPQARIPFLEVTDLLAAHDLPVPRVLAASEEQRLILLEDLGGTHLGDLAGDERDARYVEAIDLLARVHAIVAPPKGALPFERAFDHEWVRFELRLFAGLDLPPGIHAEVDAAIEAMAAYIAALPRVLSLRDYQSQNLMIDPVGRLRILDYQDALLAPPALDLAALLFDSYVDISREMRCELLAAYEAASGHPVDRNALAVVTAQRKCKDLSRYRFVATTKGDTRYASYEAPARAAVLEALSGFPRDLERAAQAIEAAIRAVTPV